MTTFRHLIGRTLRIRGLDVTFRLWRRYQHARVYINAPGSPCTRHDYVDLRTGQLHCTHAAMRLIETALQLDTEDQQPCLTPHK